MLNILSRAADLNPQKTILEPADWLVHIQLEDELHNQVQVQLLDHLFSEAQLGELQDHSVLQGLLECRVLHGAQLGLAEMSSFNCI